MTKIIDIIEEIVANYEDSELTSYHTRIEDESNEAEIYSTPRFINEYDINYFNDESEVYELYDELQDELLIHNVEMELIEAENNEDYHIIRINW